MTLVETIKNNWLIIVIGILFVCIFIYQKLKERKIRKKQEEAEYLRNIPQAKREFTQEPMDMTESLYMDPDFKDTYLMEENNIMTLKNLRDSVFKDLNKARDTYMKGRERYKELWDISNKTKIHYEKLRQQLKMYDEEIAKMENKR